MPALVLALALVAAGCDGGGHQDRGIRGPAPAPGPGPGLGPATVSDDVAAAHGIVMVACDTTSYSVTVLDAGDGRVVARRARDGLSIDAPFCGAQASPFELRQGFDGGYTRLAVTVGEGVGYVDTDTGATVGLTAPAPGARSPAQRNPLFRPGTDDIWFLDQSRPDDVSLRSVAARGGAVVGEHGSFRSRGPDSRPGFVLSPGTGSVIELPAAGPLPSPGPDDPAPDPGGTVAAQVVPDLADPGVCAPRPSCPALRIYDLGGGVLELGPAREALRGAVRATLPLDDDHCCSQAVAWLDAGTVLLGSERPLSGPQVSVARLGSGFTGPLRVEDLLPGDGQAASNPVASPDGTEVVFLNDDGLFRVPTRTGSAPVRIVEASALPPGVPLEWHA